MDVFCKTNVKLLPVAEAVVDGLSENEWKWNTMNKNVLSNTFFLVESIFVCYQYHTTKSFFPLVFIYFYFFTTGKTEKLKKSNNNNNNNKMSRHTLLQSEGYVKKKSLPLQQVQC